MGKLYRCYRCSKAPCPSQSWSSMGTYCPSLTIFTYAIFLQIQEFGNRILWTIFQWHPFLLRWVPQNIIPPFLSILVQHSASKGESLFLLCAGKNGAMDALRKSGTTQKNASFTTALCKTEDKSIDHLPMTWRFLRFIFCRFIELLGAWVCSVGAVSLKYFVLTWKGRHFQRRDHQILSKMVPGQYCGQCWKRDKKIFLGWGDAKVV